MSTWYFKDTKETPDQLWSDVNNWWSNGDGTGSHPAAAPWTTDVAGNADNLSLATGAAPPAIDCAIGNTGWTNQITGECDIVGLINNNNIGGGTFSCAGFINNWAIDGGTFSGDGFVNYSNITGGTFSGDGFVNYNFIAGGTFSGAGFVNYSNIYGGTFSGEGFINNYGIYGGTFSGEGFINVGTFNGGTFSGMLVVSVLRNGLSFNTGTQPGTVTFTNDRASVLDVLGAGLL
jgi:hypothetical protein